MRYAVFGDIHGNLHALEAVLHAYQEENIDRYVCTGDLVGYGAHPSECVAQVRRFCTDIVAGNHDYAACEKLTLEFFNSYAKAAILWTRSHLSPEELDFLEGLPLLLEIDDVLTLSHATIYDPHTFDYIQTQYDAHLSLQRMTTAVGFVGHSHIPISFLLKDGAVTWTLDPEIDLSACDKALVNVGSVGQPRDENPDAAYAIYDSEEQKVWIKRQSYDVEAAVQGIEAEGLPPVLGERLRLGK